MVTCYPVRQNPHRGLVANPLAYAGSLSVILRLAAKQNFQVQRVFEGFVKLSNEDRALLPFACQHYAWCRKVHLCVDQESWVQARTFISQESLQGPVRQLLFLKNKPLGDALFRDPHLKRSEFYFSQDGLTRASVFYFFDQPVWVEECFSAKAQAYLKKMF